MTDRAIRNDHRDVDLVGLAARQNFRRVGLDGDTVAAVGRRAEKSRRDFADASRLLRLDQRRQRKPGAGVGRGGVLAVVADVRDAQVMLRGRVAVIDLVEFCAAIVRGARTLVALGRIVRCGRRHDRDAGILQWLLQRLERRREVVRPAVRRGVADRDIVIARPFHVRHRRIVVRGEPKLLVEIVHHRRLLKPGETARRGGHRNI